MRVDELSIDTEWDTRNKSAEFLKNRNNCASENNGLEIHER